MPKKPSDVSEYLEIGCGRCRLGATPECKVHRWHDVLIALRSIINQSSLDETIKWGVPCYSAQGKNVLILSALKDGAIISFFRGAQMSDPLEVLEKPGDNSRYARYWRFTDAAQVNDAKQDIMDYVNEAIKVRLLDAPLPDEDKALPPYPAELKAIFKQQPDFKDAFLALTPGRQRGYLLYFNAAKQSKTKSARIEKSKAAIYKGKGWNER